ncbi:MAG: metallophosphoesterase family protein, partial [Myxococcales bacterium]|nr:metallophosphoesterase family protein [Myxococcales bacterium]
LVRGEIVCARPAPELARLLAAKYALALAGGLCAAPFGGFLPFALVFYAIEAQMVFLAPALLDHPGLTRRELLAHCRDLTGRTGGTVATMRTVIPIAVRMLLGGLPSGDPVRAWSLGAIAVVLWYEDLLARPPATTASHAHLDVGGHAPLHVREEAVDLGLGLTLLHASDLHLRANGRSARVVEGVVHAARGVDAVLLGGDLLDGPSGEPLLTDLVRRCPRVLAIPGNHDRWVGVGRVRRAVERGSGTWLTGEALVGGLVVGTGGTPSARPALLLVHVPRQAVGGWDLAVAGHLHGGQVVLVERTRMWPGALLDGRTGRRFVVDGTPLLVSRGASDTLPVRWRCPREVLRIAL